MKVGRLARALHRLHRVLGSVFALLLTMWFGSGAVMTFARYPSYTEQERIAHARPLLAARELGAPPLLQARLVAGGLELGDPPRLAMVEEQLTWLFSGPDGERIALRAQDGSLVTKLTRERAEREAQQRLNARVLSAEELTSYDQWTVGRHFRPWFPLFRIALDDRDRTEVYVSAQTGEIVQQSTRTERVLAWLGPIPHWIYPAALRNESGLWRTTVLTLVAFALAVALSGLFAGVHLTWVERRTKSKRGQKPAIRLSDPYLRWHQRLGLIFGLFVCTWLFSGALSLSPFAWSRGAWPSAAEVAATHRTTVGKGEVLPIAKALARCRMQLNVVELKIVGLADTLYALCVDKNGHTRHVNLRDPAMTVQSRIDARTLHTLVGRLAPLQTSATVNLETQPDDYHYPTHQDSAFSRNYVRFDLRDREQTSFYFDPARLRLLARHTQTTRLERWLYHGVHSFDFPVLYKYRALWRSLMIVTMTLGFTLSTLGLAMAVRRVRRRLLARARDISRPQQRA